MFIEFDHKEKCKMLNDHYTLFLQKHISTTLCVCLFKLLFLSVLEYPFSCTFNCGSHTFHYITRSINGKCLQLKELSYFLKISTIDI